MGGTSLLPVQSGPIKTGRAKANENEKAARRRLMPGWMKIHRKIQDWEWWGDPVMVKVWLQILFDANFETKRWRGHQVDRGQLIYGRRSYAKKCCISEQQMRTCIERLKSTHQITSQSTNKYSLITVCQYDLYQSDEPESTIKLTNKSAIKQPTINQQSTTPKELKNIRTKEYTSWTDPSAEEHGKYARLTKEEWEIIIGIMGETKAKQMTERFNGYIEQIGRPAGVKKYKSHKATILNWHNKDLESGKQPNGTVKGFIPKRDSFQQREYDDAFFEKIANSSLKKEGGST